MDKGMMNTRYGAAAKFTGAVTVAFMTMALLALAVMGVMIFMTGPAGAASVLSQGSDMMMPGGQQMPQMPRMPNSSPGMSSQDMPNKGMSSPDMPHQGMTGSGMSSQDMPHQGMTGPGMMGRDMMMGQGSHRNWGAHRGRGYGHRGGGVGDRVRPVSHLTIEDVRHHFQHRLARRGNKRLKLGAVKMINDDTITADIVTVDESLVRRLSVDRHSGRISREN